MKKREPLGMLEAVYFIQPNEKVGKKKKHFSIENFLPGFSPSPNLSMILIKQMHWYQNIKQHMCFLLKVIRKIMFRSYEDINNFAYQCLFLSSIAFFSF